MCTSIWHALNIHKSQNRRRLQSKFHWLRAILAKQKFLSNYHTFFSFCHLHVFHLISQKQSMKIVCLTLNIARHMDLDMVWFVCFARCENSMRTANEKSHRKSVISLFSLCVYEMMMMGCHAVWTLSRLDESNQKDSTLLCIVDFRVSNTGTAVDEPESNDVRTNLVIFFWSKTISFSSEKKNRNCPAQRWRKTLNVWLV